MKRTDEALIERLEDYRRMLKDHPGREREVLLGLIGVVHVLAAHMKFMVLADDESDPNELTYEEVKGRQDVKTDT